MRVVLIAAANSVHTVRWANAYVERGCTVHLITQHEPLGSLSPAVDVQKLDHMGGMGYALNAGRVVHGIKRANADVVNIHYASGYGSFARWIDRVPIVLNVWGSDVFEFPDRSALHRWWLLGNLRAARCVVSTSHAMAARVRALFPAIPKLEVVPFGVDISRFVPNALVHDTIQSIGTVKTLAHTYGTDRLLEAFARIGKGGLRLRIVGDGPQRAELERKAADLGIADAVDFVGPVPHAQVPAELEHMGVFLALSRSESFGVAVIEASACGLPVIVSDAGGLPEVVCDGVTGFVVPDGDPTIAAEKLSRLVKDPALRRRMGMEGRRWVEERYEWEQCADCMVRLLEQNAHA